MPDEGIHCPQINPLWLLLSKAQVKRTVGIGNQKALSAYNKGSNTPTKTIRWLVRLAPRIAAIQETCFLTDSIRSGLVRACGETTTIP